jgi:hypothetical protein
MSQWNWRRLDERLDDPRVERQLHEYGCGAACVVMLLADRGVAADQLVVTAGLHLPSTAYELASRLNEFSVGERRWIGGHLDVDPPPGREHLRALSQTGSWAALLVPANLRAGHWVVVDGPVDDATVAVRDPVGASYRMSAEELLHLMRYMVVVFEALETGGTP